MVPLLHVVLVEPQIPNNTGNIGRTCVATGCALHLVHPLGFDTSEKACRRAGLDYWPRLDVREHASWEAFVPPPPARMWLFSTKGKRTYFDADFRPGDTLVFGNEGHGLPDAVLHNTSPEQVLTLPMLAGERSLNLATAVCTALYEGVRQMVVRGELRVIGGRITSSFTGNGAKG